MATLSRLYLSITARLSTMLTTQLFPEKWPLWTYIPAYPSRCIPFYLIASSEWKLVTITRIRSRLQEESHKEHGSIHMCFWFLPTVQVLFMATFKFVDDVTLTELIDRSNISREQLVADKVADWSHRNLMNINTKKTKEMLFGRITEDPLPQITFSTGAIDRVTSFKLLGLLFNKALAVELEMATRRWWLHILHQMC